ncbi:hypothetical protein ACFSHQ_02535 [Gemmobacter lanyuensis]
MIDLLDRVSTGRDHGITETALMDDLEACSRANDILELWISGRIRHLSVVSEACHRPGPTLQVILFLRVGAVLHGRNRNCRALAKIIENPTAAGDINRNK